MTAHALAEELRRRRDWQAAYDAFAALPERTGATVEGLAESAWWLGRMDESIRLYSEAFRLHTDAGDGGPAVLVAVQLSICTRLVGEAAQSAGWVNRAQRILEDLPECSAHGYPLYLGTAGLTGSDLEAADASSRRLQELGRRYDDATLSALRSRSARSFGR